ncbi:hypothetical protein RHGRI_011865 [Rhododendron griersonianum]|uniref:NAC domain-containing protein n=1 Tax=Rhododendron griersonianum TaxID=479676 RepID=A0AAV6KNY8_9ERIC|nr:hypothetical protein RHGRI_011865 [Rhododendron griersonianum]
MTVPTGYLFRPTDQELLLKYLDKKCTNEALPCGIVIEREIYGAVDKAPWQIFTDEEENPWEISKTKDKKTDLWKTEGTIYVFTTLIKASQNRIARKAGCGSWHGETAREEVKNNKDCAIGYKTTLYFEIASDEPIAMDGPVKKGHWIMQEYSLRDGNTDKSKGKYVLCRIKRFDSKYTKISPRKRKNVEAANTDNDLVVSNPAKRVRTEVMQEKKMECDIAAAPDTEVVPFSKDQQFVQDQSVLMSDDPNELTLDQDFDEVFAYLNEQVATTDDDIIVPKSAKRFRTELVGENKMDSDVVAAPETEVVPFLEELLEQEQRFTMSNDANELTVEELEAIWEEEEQESYSPKHCDNSALVPLDSNTVTSNTNFHMSTAYLDESVLPVVEQQQDFGLDCNAFGYFSSTPEDDWVQYSNPSHTWAENLSNTEAWLNAELLPSDQESDTFLSPNSRFHATAEPSPIFSFSNEFFLDQQKNNMSQLEWNPETLWWLKNMGKRISSLNMG